MDEIPKASSAEPSPADPARWIGRVIIAVILAEGIWGIIVSGTNNLILPLLARTMGSDVQSPLYLGKGEFNVPALFTSVLEFCFAGIAAVVLNAWAQRKPAPKRSKSVRIAPISVQAASSPSQPAVAPGRATPSVPAHVTVPIPAPVTAPKSEASTAPPSGQFWSPPEPSRPKAATPPPSPPAKPAKPKPPREVYYNIVGEPINPTEDE